MSRRSVKTKPSVLLPPIEPSPYDVSGVIYAIFNELPFTVDTADTALVKLGDTTHKEQPVDEYQKKLDLCSELEEEIQQAIAKQLTEKENQLKTAREKFPTYPDTNLLTKPCPVSQYLNEDSLRRHGLLVPSDFQVTVSPTHEPPQREYPNYMSNTFTFNQHSTVQSDPAKKIPTKPQPVWKFTMSAESREAVKKSLSQLERRANYLHNPRHSAHVHINTASYGPVKMKKEDNNIQQERLFIAEPPEIIFTGYLPGETYQSILELRNISDASRRLAIVSPSTSYFTATKLQFPNPDGIIAPGMSCSYIIKFTPDSLTDFSDEIKVLSHIGQCLSVPLKGYRPPPNLTLPQVLECGYCLVDGFVSMEYECRNEGGDGNFMLLTQTDITSEHFETLDTSIKLGPFIVTPAQFYVPQGKSINIKVTFEPKECIGYSEQLTIACDNGQAKTLTLLGNGEKVSVNCVYIGPSTTCTAIHTAVDCSIDISKEIEPVIEFDDTNPGIQLYQTAMIKNYSNVSLEYQWKFYHPRTQLTKWDGNIELSPLILYELSPFAVDIIQGTLLPNETKPFNFTFMPTEEGNFRSMAYLELLNITEGSLDTCNEGITWIKQSEINEKRELTAAVICMDIMGTAQPYLVELVPPFIELISEIPMCTEIRKKVLIKNHSLNNISYNWKQITTDEISVINEPFNGTILPNDCCYTEVILYTANKKVSFNISLQCSVEYSHEPFTLPIKGTVQGPRVKFDMPSLEFGLVRFGETVSRPLKLINHSNCSVSYELRQPVIQSETISDNNEELPVVNYECLSMRPSPVGELLANSSATVTVNCTPNLYCGRLRSVIECLVHGERTDVIEVSAELQRPMLVLESSTIHIDKCYVSVPVISTLTLVNRTLLSTNYQWISDTHEYVDLEFSPNQGYIGPREKVTINLQSIWKTKGCYTGVIGVCCADGMNYPVLLSISANVFGVSVTYSINKNSETCFDFGSSNIICEPQSMTLCVANTSAIATNLSVFVDRFPSSNISNTNTSKPTTNKSSKQLLCSTKNSLATSNSKTEKKAKEELISNYLSDGRGACFVIEPSNCPLDPFESKLIKVTAYSNMWGQYSDKLTCKVNGLDAKVFPIHYGVVRSPVYFQPTATYDKTLVRLGCQLAGSESVKRNIKFTNTSSSTICLDWRPFSIIPDDDKLVDLIWYCGHPFLSSEDESNHDTLSIKVHLFPHEGNPTNNLFTIEPKQTILGPHTSGSVEVSFHPSVQAYNEIGEQIKGYVLGYMSLTANQKCSPFGVSRDDAYNISPVRIDITASITHPKITLKTDSDDNSFSFTHCTSELIVDNQIADEVKKSHYITFTNHMQTILTFHTLPLSRQFKLSLTGKENFTLEPRQTIKGFLVVSLSHNDILDQLKSNNKLERITLNDTLTVVYSTGVIQEFPISVQLVLPQLSIYPLKLNYETGTIGYSMLSSFQVRNSSYCVMKWTVKIPQEWSDIVQVNPETGTIQNESETVQVSFTPRAERHYSIPVVVCDEITQYYCTINITGRGSVDEYFRRQRKTKKKEKNNKTTF